MSEYRIKEGDEVTVSWDADNVILKGTVRYVPQCAGDSWIIESDKGVTYVQQFETIFRRKP